MSDTRQDRPAGESPQVPEARLVSEPERQDLPDPDDLPGDQGKRKKGFLRGPLGWMTNNTVAANILMFVLLAGGAIKAYDIKQEVFPEFDLETIVVNVPYPGASPEEVEQGVVLAVEESVRSIDGVKKVTSTATEGFGVSTVELLLGTDTDQALNEIKAAVDRITSFPENIERPTVFMARLQSQVTSLVFYGDQSEKALKDIAERAREELLQDERITVIEIDGVRPLEISVEVAQEDLRRYHLTIDQVAGVIRQASVELPGGGIKTAGGEVLVRTAERRDTGQELEAVALLSLPDGTTVHLGDIANVVDGFAETDQETTYNGQRAVMLNVFRVGEQTPIDVSNAVREYIAAAKDTLPPGVQVAEWFDRSDFYKERRDLLYRNAMMGLVLVLLVLGVFLEIRLAFWVTMGIPISFVGALLFLPMTDVSINMISMFAFILVLGMVVDDAIIVGESIYRWRQKGLSRLEAAVQGVREVAVPVTFAIITTVIAYLPMLFVPGIMGKFFRVIPIVVIIVLIMSLVESLLILPAHLAQSQPSQRGIFGWINTQQQRFSRVLERHIQRFYVPMVTAAVRRRYLTMCVCFAVFFATIGLVAGGRVAFEFMPSVDSDVIQVQAEMPYGTAIERTREVQERLVSAAEELLEEYGGEDQLSKGIYSNLGSGIFLGGPGGPPTGSSGSHLTGAAVYLVPTDLRDFTASDFTRAWRKQVGEIPGIDRLRFQYSTGPGSGTPINIELSHPNMDRLRAAATDLAVRLQDFAGTYDVDDGFTDGKEQLDIELTAEGRALGLTELELARQIRSAFFGAEAVRQQRGRDELRVYVRLPRDERKSEYNIEEMIVRTPQGGEIPLSRAAHIDRGSSYTQIKRIDGRRAVSVTSEVDTAVANAEQIMNNLTTEVLPELLAAHPGVQFGLGGDALEQRDAMGSLFVGLGMAVLGIFGVLAIVFRSYMQPVVVLLAVPFGIVGAVIGHIVMGFNLSFMSMMGIVALSGVVVNDSLVLIDAVNRLRVTGMPMLDSVIAGGAVRFRPIILTSLTTFFGLAPMILETSVQARFLIPMAISLGFGIIFATLITLLLVPAAYVIMEDGVRGLKHAWRWVWGTDQAPRSEAAKQE